MQCTCLCTMCNMHNRKSYTLYINMDLCEYNICVYNWVQRKHEKGLKTDEFKLNLLYYCHRITMKNYHKEIITS